MRPRRIGRTERLWRELKDVVEMRPVYHWRRKDNIRGHIFVCFLALYLAAFLRKTQIEQLQDVSSIGTRATSSLTAPQWQVASGIERQLSVDEHR